MLVAGDIKQTLRLIFFWTPCSSNEGNKHPRSSIPHNVVTLKFQDENSIPTIVDTKIEDDLKLETKTTGKNEDDHKEDNDKIKYEITLRSPI